MKNNWKRFLPVYIITILVMFVPMIIGAIYWPLLPESIATHFSLSGEPNGFSSKGMAVYGFPLFELAGQLIIIFSFLFYDEKKIPLFFEILLYWIFPVVSIITSIAIYKDVLNLNVDIVFITLMLVAVVYMITGNYVPKIHEYKQTGFSFIFNRILGWSFFASGIVLFILCFTEIKILTLITLFIPIIVSIVLFIYKLAKGKE